MRTAFGICTVTLLGSVVAPGLSDAQTVANDRRVTVPEVHTVTSDGPIQQNGKNATNRTINLDFKNVPLIDAIRAIARDANVWIGYSLDIIPTDKTVTLKAQQIRVGDALRAILRGTGVDVRVSTAGNIQLVKTEHARADTLRDMETVTGKVLDSITRKGIKGATITVVGTTISTTTNDNGDFRLIGVQAGRQSFTIRLLGYGTKTIPVNVESGGAPVTIVLQQVSTSLSEVVTTATGLQRRVEIGHDIATIKADSLLRIAPIRSVSDMLAIARVPGVTVEQSSGLPGAPSRIRIRGIGSIMGDNDPVVLVDGVRIAASTSGSSITSMLDNQTELTSRLNDIDPESIETIEVLRGPSAGALYGADAANGVIVITTKKGKAGPTRWSLSMSRDWNTLRGYPATTYTGWGRSLTNDTPVKCDISGVVSGTCVQDSVSAFTPSDYALLDAEAGGNTSQMSLGLNGGTSQFQYSVTTTYRHDVGPTRMRPVDQLRFQYVDLPIPQGMIRPNQLGTKSLSANITLSPMSKLDIGLRTQFTQNDRTANSAETGGLPNFIDTTPTSFRPELSRNSELVSRVILSGQTTWRPFTWLTGSGDAGIDRVSQSETRTKESYTCTGMCGIPIRGRQEGRTEQTMFSFNLRGSITDLGGSLVSRWISLRPTFGLNFSQQMKSRIALRVDTVSANGGVVQWSRSAQASGDSLRTATAGMYMDVNIGLFQRLYTSIGMRRDGGSAFGSRSGFQGFPKFNTSWLLSDEPFFPKTNIANSVRLRFGLGVAGVQPVNGAVDGGFAVTQQIVNGQIVNALQSQIFGNSRLKPERGFEMEYGIDVEALDSRVSMGLTMAHKRSRNVIVTQPVAPSIALGLIRYENIALVLNRTFEGFLDTRVIERNDLLLTVRTSMSSRFNRVGKVGSAFLIGNTGGARLVEGYPLAAKWDRPVIGYYDADGDGLLAASEIVYSDSAVYTGWGQPKYSLGYSSSLSFWGRRITVTSDFAHDLAMTQGVGCSTPGTAQCNGAIGMQDVNATIEEQLRMWNCDWQGACSKGITSRRGETYSVLRWNAASVSVNLPDALIRHVRVRSASLQFSGRSLGVWTKYTGRDPGVTSLASEMRWDPGNLIPPPRKYSLGMRVGL